MRSYFTCQPGTVDKPLSSWATIWADNHSSSNPKLLITQLSCAFVPEFRGERIVWASRTPGTKIWYTVDWEEDRRSADLERATAAALTLIVKSSIMELTR